MMEQVEEMRQRRDYWMQSIVNIVDFADIFDIVYIVYIVDCGIN